MDELEDLKKAVKGEMLSKREQALRRIGVEGVPLDLKITGILREAFPGGFQEVMEDIVPFLAENRMDYHDLMATWENASPTDKGILKPEDFLAAVGINVAMFLGDITSAAFNRGATMAAMLAAVNQPKVMKASIDAATAAKGGSVADRKMLMQITKTMPTPKGSEVNINFGPQTLQGSKGDQKQIEEGEDSYIRFEGFAKEAVDYMRVGDGRRLLNEAIEPMEVDLDVVEGELED